MNGFYRGYLSETLCNLAMSFQAAGRRTEAAPFFSELAEQADAYTLNQLAWKLATGPDPKLRDGPTAVTLAEMAAARTRRTNFMILDTLAAAYAEADLFTNAVGIQKEAAALLQNDQEKRGYDFRLKYYESNLPYRDHGLLAEMASTRLREGNLAEAERLARECLTIREREIPGEWRTFNARSILGAALLGQKKYADSEPFLLSSYEPMRQLAGTIPQEGKVRLRELLHRLVQLYEATARPDEAAKWKKRLSGSDTP
jgi:hypothetical protein